MAKKTSRTTRRRTTHKVVHVGPDRTAEGESFAAVKEKPGRFLVGISIVNLRTVKRYDLNKTSEFYFKADGGKAIKTRVPDIGTFQLRENQDLLFRSDTPTLWYQMVTFNPEEEKTLKVTVELREADPGRDMRLATETYEIKCPSKTKYVILEPEDQMTKAKLKIFAKRTIA